MTYQKRTFKLNSNGFEHFSKKYPDVKKKKRFGFKTISSE